MRPFLDAQDLRDPIEQQVLDVRATARVALRQPLATASQATSRSDCGEGPGS